MAYGGHSFGKKTFHKPTYCHHCSDLLWGLIGQGYICEGTFYAPIYITLNYSPKRYSLSLFRHYPKTEKYICMKIRKRKSVYSLSSERKIRIPLLKRLQKKKERNNFHPKKWKYRKFIAFYDGKVDFESWNFPTCC